MPLRDVLTALFVALVLGSNFVAIKIGLETVPPLLLTGLRFLFAAVPAVLFIRPPKAPARLVVAFGFTLGVVQFGLLFVAIRLGMPAGLSSLVIQMQVFFTIALAYALLGERPAGPQVFGGLVAAGGVAVIAVGRVQGATLMPMMLVIGAAMAWGSANIIVKKAGRIDMLALMVWGSLVAPPPLFALSLLIEGQDAVFSALAHLTWRAVGAIVFLAYPSTLLAFALWNRLLSRYPAATVTPFALLVPVAGIASTSLVLGEAFGGIELAGAALVLAGLALNVRGASRRSEKGARLEMAASLPARRDATLT